jgi:VanZ family protein
VKSTFIKYHLPVLIYAGLIFWGSSISSIPAKFPFTIKDKFLHIGEFAVFGILLTRSAAVMVRSRRQRLILFWILLSGGVFAASDEIHQYFVPGRTCDIYDWLADIVGLALGAAIVYIVIRKKRVAGDN